MCYMSFNTSQMLSTTPNSIASWTSRVSYASPLYLQYETIIQNIQTYL